MEIRTLRAIEDIAEMDFSSTAYLQMEIAHEHLTTQLNLLYYKFNFTRLIFLHATTLHSSLGYRLLILLEHQAYAQRIFISLVLPLKQQIVTLTRWWNSAAFWEWKLTKVLDVALFKNTPLFFSKAEDRYLREEEFYSELPQDIFNGKGILKFSLHSGEITHTGIDIEWQQDFSCRAILNYPLELWPMLLGKASIRYSHSLKILFYKSIEDILEVEISNREQAFRMLLLELERIQELYLLLAKMCKHFELSILARLIDSILAEIRHLLLENSSDSFGYTYPRISGQRFTAAWLKEVSHFIRRAELYTHKIERSLHKNYFFTQSLSSVKLDERNAVELGGAVSSACGRGRDVRTFYPYYLYSQILHRPIVGQHMSLLDIYLVWMSDVKATLELLTNIVAGIPYQSESEKGKIDLLEQWERYEQPTDEFAILGHSTIAVARGELGMTWLIDQGVKKPVVTMPGAEHIPYFLKFSCGKRLEQFEWSIPFWGIDLQEMVF